MSYINQVRSVEYENEGNHLATVGYIEREAVGSSSSCILWVRRTDS